MYLRRCVFIPYALNFEAFIIASLHHATLVAEKPIKRYTCT